MTERPIMDLIVGDKVTYDDPIIGKKKYMIMYVIESGMTGPRNDTPYKTVALKPEDGGEPIYLQCIQDMPADNAATFLVKRAETVARETREAWMQRRANEDAARIRNKSDIREIVKRLLDLYGVTPEGFAAYARDRDAGDKAAAVTNGQAFVNAMQSINTEEERAPGERLLTPFAARFKSEEN